MINAMLLATIGVNWFAILAPLTILIVCLYKFGYSVKAFLSFIGIMIMFFMITDAAFSFS
jgi:hypothetical protein